MAGDVTPQAFPSESSGNSPGLSPGRGDTPTAPSSKSEARPNRGQKSVPSSHFTWEDDHFETLAEAIDIGRRVNNPGLEAKKKRLSALHTCASESTLGSSNTSKQSVSTSTGVALQKRNPDSRCTRLGYVTERIMSEYGRKVQIPMLLVAGAIQVILFGILWAMVWRYEERDPRPQARVSRYIEGFWAAWTFMSDGGTHAKYYHAEQRFAGGVITTGGIIYLAAVLAFIVDMVREKMDSMRVGKGNVHESDHTVILHWTDRTIPLIQELCIANDAVNGGVVVVLAKESMETMSTEIAAQLPKRQRFGTKIVCRYGNPAVVGDLLKVSADRAKAVIILADGRGADDSDSATLRCILSIKSMGYKISGHIVCEVKDIDNEPLLQLVGGKMIETFVSHDVLGRLMLMSVRQMGLAEIYDSMLGFDGSEFYMQAWPELEGFRFGELFERFPKAIPLGIRTACDGVVHLNPSPDMQILVDDELIVIAEDATSYKPERPPGDEAARSKRWLEMWANGETMELPAFQFPAKVIEKVLICGWRRDIRDILKLLDKKLPCGSEVHTMTHSLPVEKRNERLLDEGLNVADLRNISLVHHWGNTSARRRLESLPLQHYTSGLIFADQSYEEDTMQADSNSVATLVLIRDIQARRRLKVQCPITCEVLDSRTQRTISGQKQLSMMSDFVQSNKFVARILAMIGENRTVKMILNELLGATGSSLFIVASSMFVFEGEKISFWELCRRGISRGAIVIGYQEKAAGKRRVTTLNPDDKDKALQWLNFDLAIIAAHTLFDSDGRDSERSTNSGNGKPAKTIARTQTGSLSSSSSLSSALQMIGTPNHVSEAAKAPQAPARGSPREATQDLASARTAATSVPEESGICASSDTAASAAVKLASKHMALMSEDERSQFGACLRVLGSSIKGGLFPAVMYGP